MAGSDTLILRVTLLSDRSVSRDIETDAGRSLYKLAEAIIRAFDFDFDHAFGFYSGRTERTLMSARPKYELFADMNGGDSDERSVKRTSVAEAFPKLGHRLTFLFDYGDEWLFGVEAIGTGRKAPKARYPKVVAKTGASPEQYPDPEEDEEDA
jgi:hypothetical protein